MIKLTLNGQPVELTADPNIPLLFVLRDVLNKTGTKFGCGAGLCGACTVHVNGAATRSCQVPLGQLQGAKVTTIEGMAPDPKGALHPLQEAWIAEQVPQCGWCQPGMIMAAAALLKELPQPSEQDIRDKVTNLCRCGTYPRIIKAIQRAATELEPLLPRKQKAPPLN